MWQRKEPAGFATYEYAKPYQDPATSTHLLNQDYMHNSIGVQEF